MKPKIIILIAALLIVILAILLISFSSITSNSVSGKVISVITPDYIELKWDNANVLNQKIGIATDCVKYEEENTTCNWEYQDLGTNAESFKDYDIDSRLKFYQIIAKVRIGEGSCTPECVSTPQGEKWKDPCTGEEFRSCATDMTAQCCLIDSDSQGWYGVSCDQLETGPTKSITDFLIKYDGTCQVISQVCERKSDVFVKFTQPLVYSQDSAKTSINWLTATQDIDLSGEHPLDTAPDFLKTNVIDYISRWDPAKQEYYGAAFATTPNGAKVVTGEFSMTQYTPYFVGAKNFEETAIGENLGEGQVTTKITWVGTLPPRITFPLKYVPIYMGEPTFSQNYIVPPFDTKLKKAVDICNELNLPDEAVVGTWDPEAQDYINSGTVSVCAIIRGPGQNSPLNFDIAPGQVYEIQGLDRDIYWRQI